MGLYDNSDSVDSYEKMCEGYDGTPIFEMLARHLEEGQSLLELGCGPCNDLAVLKERYNVVGSDTSDEFLRRGRLNHSDIEFQSLDAAGLDTERRFDCVYSNKVLHHLSLEDLIISFRRQKQVIAEDGLFAHSFWIGDQKFEKDGLLFLFHSRESLLGLVGDYFEIVELLDYKEFEEGDSLFVIARNGRQHDETTIL